MPLWHHKTHEQDDVRFSDSMAISGWFSTPALFHHQNMLGYQLFSLKLLRDYFFLISFGFLLRVSDEFLVFPDHKRLTWYAWQFIKSQFRQSYFHFHASHQKYPGRRIGTWLWSSAGSSAGDVAGGWRRSGRVRGAGPPSLQILPSLLVSHTSPDEWLTSPRRPCQSSRRWCGGRVVPSMRRGRWPWSSTFSSSQSWTDSAVQAASVWPPRWVSWAGGRWGPGRTR